jgi:hypothetical protein
MPMWPPIFTAAPAQPAATATPLATAAARRRWLIVDENLRREVDEREYTAALGSCDRVEVVHYPHEDVITHMCYRPKR